MTLTVIFSVSITRKSMNLNEYIVQKSLEKTTAKIIKQKICEDASLSNQQKADWLALIDAYSKAKEIKDLLTFLRNSRW